MDPVKRVLVIDDDECVLEVVMMMLERLGYKVLGTTSGTEAMGIYKENGSRIDVVILDLNLSNESGGDVFKQIREVNPTARVIILTGYGEPQEVSKLMDLGCWGVLQKPLSLNLLSETLSRCCQSRFVPSFKLISRFSDQQTDIS